MRDLWEKDEDFLKEYTLLLYTHASNRAIFLNHSNGVLGSLLSFMKVYVSPDTVRYILLGCYNTSYNHRIIDFSSLPSSSLITAR